MANRRNAIKKIRADEKKQAQNQVTRSRIKTLMRRFTALCQDKKTDEARALSAELFRRYDMAIKKGLFKDNTVGRRKSRISRTLNLIKA